MTGRGRVRLFGAVCAVVLALAGTGCASPTAAVTSGARVVVGRWSYVATRTGTTLVMDGTIAVEHQDGASISGVLEAEERDGPSVARPVTGIVGGRVVNDSTVEFELLLGAGRTRRHVAVLVRDSLRGAWVDLTDGNAATSGAFRGKRTGP